MHVPGQELRTVTHRTRITQGGGVPKEDRASARGKVCTQDDVGNPHTQSGTDQLDLADGHGAAADTPQAEVGAEGRAGRGLGSVLVWTLATECGR